MYVTHIIGVFSPEHGGPVVSLANYARGQAEAGLDVRIRTVEGYPHTSPAVRIDGDVDQKVFHISWPAKLGRSRALSRWLAEESTPDVYHLHGAWLRAMFYGYREAKSRDRPYLIEINGAYQPYELRRKPWRKRLVRAWFQDQMLEEAFCLHVNSNREARQMREFGFTKPIVVIPAGFEPPPADIEPQCPGQLKNGESGPFFLYLARIHPNKGIEVLLRAWSELASSYPEMRLVVAGEGEPGYVRRCRALAQSLGLDGRCVWLGLVSEAEKSWLYGHATWVCLPSYTENFGNTVQEALGFGTPVLTTMETPWTELARQGCGWVAECTQDSVTECMACALATAVEEICIMGRAGQKLVLSEYSLESVIEKQIATYRWMCGNPLAANLLFAG